MIGDFVPEHGLDGRDGRLHDDGDRPEHRRRLRGPARPRLRRVLRGRRYTAGWFASQQFDQGRSTSAPSGSPTALPGIHISIWLVLLAAGLLTLLAGIVIGLPTLRLRGDYLAIVTLGFGEILPQFVRNGDNFGGFDLTHGTFGITPIDSLGFGAIGAALGLPESFLPVVEPRRSGLLDRARAPADHVFCSVRLRDSRLGRAWIAIREDETAAAAMGIPLMRTKTWAYALGAFFGGVAGAFYASFKSGAFPADFYFNISVFLLCMVILGGMGNVWGVHPRRHDPRLPQREGLATIGSKIQRPASRLDDFDLPKYQFGIYGIIIVLMMLFRPAGLIPSAGTRSRWPRASTTRRSTTCSTRARSPTETRR